MSHICPLSSKLITKKCLFHVKRSRQRMKQSSKCWFKVVTEKKGICVRSLLEFIVSTMWFIRNKLFYLMQDKHHSYLPTIFIYCKKSITQYGSGPEFQFICYFETKKDLNFKKKKETSQKMNPVCFVD